MAAWACRGSLGLIDDERAAYAYFGKSTEHGVPQAVPRYTNVTADEFELLALSGRPFVLEDGGRGQPFVGWTCDRFRKEYPNGVVKIEYVKGIKTAWSIKDKWEGEQHPIPNADPDGPKYAPWYWGVKGADDPEDAKTIFKGKKSPLPKVQKLMRIPDYMRSTRENQNEVFGSPEFWFSMPDAGAAMHMDAHCESTLAIQLSGKRKWKLGWVPPVPNGTIYKEGTYGDGAIYGKQYAPPLEAIVSEGEALFMPPAFLHSTTNIGDGCAASMTFQFRDPIPGQYFRQSLRHLLRSADFVECWGFMGQVAAVQETASKKNKLKPPKLSSVDKDGDGRFVLAEAVTRIQRASVVFHDVDGDGAVTAAELDAGWSAFQHATAEGKAKGNRRTKPKSFAYLAEGDDGAQEL